MELYGDFIMAWRNVWRNPRRSVLTILALLFATTLLIFMLSFQFGSYEDMINATVRQSTGHLQVQAKEYEQRLEMHLVVPSPVQLIQLLKEREEVKYTALRSESFALVSGEKRSRGVSVIGVEPQQEEQFSVLPSRITAGRYLAPEDRNRVVIGSLCAKRLQLNLGDRCTLLGQGADGSVAAALVTIGGIFETGIEATDRSTMYIPLQDFDTVFSMTGAVHRIVIITKTLDQVAPLATTLSEMDAFSGLQILDWDELSPGLRQSMELDLISGIFLYLILIVIVVFSILNTFFMAFFERTHEFGVLLSIGTKPARLMRLILMESATLTLIGLSVGTVIGAATTLFFAHYGIGFGEGGELLAQYGFEDRFYPKLSMLSLCLGPSVLLVTTMLSALIPALKVPALKPAEALKSC